MKILLFGATGMVTASAREPAGYRAMYGVIRPIAPLLQRWLPGAMTTTEQLGRAMMPSRAGL